MALFKNGKKLSLDDILKGVEYLTPEEQEKVKEKMEDLYKAEDEREIDKVEKEKADNEDVKGEKETDENEESTEIGKDVDEVEDDFKKDEGVEELEDGTKDVAGDEIEKHEEDDKDWRTALESRITALEETIKGLARKPKEVEKDVSDKLEDLAKKYN